MCQAMLIHYGTPYPSEEWLGLGWEKVAGEGGGRDRDPWLESKGINN